MITVFNILLLIRPKREKISCGPECDLSGAAVADKILSKIHFGDTVMERDFRHFAFSWIEMLKFREIEGLHMKI